MSMPIIVIITIVAYFVLLMALSYFASRGSDNSTFFTGGRQTHWAWVAFAMMGASISGVTFISVPGMVIGKGYAYLQMVLGFIVGYALIGFVLVPLFYILSPAFFRDVMHSRSLGLSSSSTDWAT